MTPTLRLPPLLSRREETSSDLGAPHAGSRGKDSVPCGRYRRGITTLKKARCQCRKSLVFTAFTSDHCDADSANPFERRRRTAGVRRPATATPTQTQRLQGAFSGHEFATSRSADVRCGRRRHRHCCCRGGGLRRCHRLRSHASWHWQMGHHGWRWCWCSAACGDSHRRRARDGHRRR